MSSELGRRIAVTLCALLVFRIGSYIPIPGIDPAVWPEIFHSQSQGILGMVDAVSGGAIQRLSILSLGIAPFVSAAVAVQLLLLVYPGAAELRRRGERGRRTIVRLTLGLAAVLTVFQALGIARGLEGITGLVSEPGPMFVVSTVVSLTGGTLFLIWLSELITVRGIGNGIALLLFVGIVSQLPAAIAGTVELGRQGVIESNLALGFAALMVGMVALIVTMELGRRCVPVAFAGADAGAPARASNLSIKLNSAGVVPAVVSSWFLYIPIVIADVGGGFDAAWMRMIVQRFGPQTPAYMATTTIAIVLFALIYTAFVLDPEEAADRLKARGGAIPGVAPGEATAAHLDQVVSRTTILGALYLAVITLIPELAIAYANVPFYFRGVSALILVCVVLDVSTQFRAQIGAQTSAHVRGDGLGEQGGSRT